LRVSGRLHSAPQVSGNFLERGGLWVLGQSALFAAVIAGGILCRNQWHGLASTIGGAFLFLLAAVCGLAGATRLGRNLTPFPKPSTSTQLVLSGIYGLIRHPLYTAVFCAALGWALVWCSGLALLAALALAPFFDAKARREERWLRQQFSEYAAYEQRVRRFIPWIY
jgi:protein-S-isoprenylcysteine O-methyltransferase Ste14